MRTTYRFIFMQIKIFFIYERFFTRACFETAEQGNLEVTHRLFAVSAHMVRNTSHWDASNAVGLPKQMNSYQSSPTFLCFESPTALFASQRNLFLNMWLDPTKEIRTSHWNLTVWIDVMNRKTCNLRKPPYFLYSICFVRHFYFEICITTFTTL